MSEKSVFENKDADLFGKVYRFIDKRNLKFVYGFLLFFIILRIINIIRFNTNWTDFLLIFFEILLMFIAILIPYYLKNKIYPIIIKSRERRQKGDIWFLNKVVIDEDIYLFKINFLLMIYNLFIILILLIGLAAFIYLMGGLGMTFGTLILLPFIPQSPFLSSGSFILAVLMLSLSFTSFEIFYKSKVTKKHIYLLLHRKFINADENKKLNRKNNDLLDSEKAFYFKQTIIFLKKYKIFKPYNNITSFSKDLIKDICSYYENVVLILFDTKTVYDEFFPRLNDAIKNDDYNALIKHLNFLESKCKARKDDYYLHIGILNRYNSKIDNNLDKFSLFREINKLKLKDHQEAFSYRVRFVYEKHKKLIYIILGAIVLIGILYYLVVKLPDSEFTRAAVNFIYDKANLNISKIIKPY